MVSEGSGQAWISQGWEGQRILQHLHIIALVGFVSKGLFPVEKEGESSTEGHVAAQEPPVLKLRKDSRQCGPSLSPLCPRALLQPFLAKSTLIHQECPLLSPS